MVVKLNPSLFCHKEKSESVGIYMFTSSRIAAKHTWIVFEQNMMYINYIQNVINVIYIVLLVSEHIIKIEIFNNYR